MSEYVFAAEASGHSRILCQASDEREALKRALESWGVRGGTRGIDGLCIRQASASDTVTFCNELGLQIEFCIKHKEHGEITMEAGSKLEALMRAACQWEETFSFGFMDTCKVYVSRRITKNESGNYVVVCGADDLYDRTAGEGYGGQ